MTTSGVTPSPATPRASSPAGRSPAGLVDEVEATREQLRAEARSKLGVTGVDEASPPLRQTLRAHNVSSYPLAALGVLSIVDLFQSYAFTVLTPEISAALGIGIGGIAAARASVSREQGSRSCCCSGPRTCCPLPPATPATSRHRSRSPSSASSRA